MRQPTFYAAVFGIIRNNEGKILFSRRANTWHLDGYLSLPAGHVENGELMKEAMIRELEEEIGINPLKLKIVLSQQSMNIHDGKTYFNSFFEVYDYTGSITNNEPDKCSELIYYSLEELENEKIVPYVYEALELMRKGEIFSDFRWDSTSL